MIEKNSKIFHQLFEKKVKGWPDARTRFTDIGCEDQYHQLFATASDSVHSLSEDIFNLYLIEEIPMEDLQKQLHKNQKAEKLSFAYYLATHSLLLYAAALHHLSSVMECEDTVSKLLEQIEILRSINDEHEQTTRAHRDRSFSEQFN